VAIALLLSVDGNSDICYYSLKHSGGGVMATKTVVKTPLKPHTSRKLLDYARNQPASKATLRDIQAKLSNIGISLSKRVAEERDKR